MDGGEGESCSSLGQDSHEDHQDVSLSWDYVTMLTDTKQKAVLFTHWQYMKAVSISTNKQKASSLVYYAHIYIYTVFQYILISVWLYVVSVQNAFKCYFNMWFRSNQLVLQQKQKTKTQALAKGEEGERERVKMMRGAYKKGMILTIRWIPSW